MQPFLPTIIFRHKKENIKKCSLKGLEKREDFQFFTYPISQIPDLTHYTLLCLDAPPLSSEDSHRGLLVLDATWRYASKMLQQLAPSLNAVNRRSIPSDYRTAYPRRQNDCPNPETGLASIEAIYAAYHILSWNTQGLLDNYYWKELFFKKNNVLNSY